MANGNVLLVTEEDYEQTDCAQAGSFQTWWVKGSTAAPRRQIVPLDKVELADLGNFPSPQGAFCSSHWFDYHGSGLVAAGFYGGGTQILDVRNPRDIKPYATRSGASPRSGTPCGCRPTRRQETGRKTNVVYSIDLVRGLDVYAVDVPGDGRGALPPASAADPTLLDKDRPRRRPARPRARRHVRRARPAPPARPARPRLTPTRRGFGRVSGKPVPLRAGR